MSQAAHTPGPDVVTSYKGFNLDWTCQGFKYEIGQAYKHAGEVRHCASGFHACENPFDVFGYYPPATSRYAIVEQKSPLSREDGGDSKIASAEITIKLELTLPDFIKRGVDWILSKVDFTNAPATNTGYQSAATNTGNQSATTNTGYQSAATNTGNQSATTNTGDQSAATNTGDQSAATNTGYQSAATNTGNQSAATNTGYQSAATNTGNRSAATNTGDRSGATVEGKHSVAVALGFEGRAKASAGGAICLVCRNEDGEIVAIRATKIGENGTEPDIFYRLTSAGEFERAEEPA